MSKKWMVRSFLALLVISSGLVLYGVLRNDDPGLTNPSARWRKTAFPLSVSTAAYDDGGHTEAVKMTKDVINVTNTRLGFKALRFEDDEGDAAIVVTIGVPQTVITEGEYASLDSVREAGGSYELRGQGGFYDSCIIEISNTGTDALLSLVFQHETGHCLGLAHDESKLSIMRDTQYTKTFGVRISDGDRKLLRSMYR